MGQAGEAAQGGVQGLTVGRRFLCSATARAAALSDLCGLRRVANAFGGTTWTLVCRCRGGGAIWKVRESFCCAFKQEFAQSCSVPELQQAGCNVALHFRERAHAAYAQAAVDHHGGIFAAEMKRQARVAYQTDGVSDLRQVQRLRSGGRRGGHARASAMADDGGRKLGN